MPTQDSPHKKNEAKLRLVIAANVITLATLAIIALGRQPTLAGMHQLPQISTRKLVIKDHDGKQRAAFEVAPADHSVAVTILDKKESMRGSFFVQEHTAGLGFFCRDRAAIIETVDQQGKETSRASLGVLRLKNGVPTAAAFSLASTGCSSTCSMCDQAGRIRVVLGTGDDCRSASLSILGPDGDFVWQRR